MNHPDPTYTWTNNYSNGEIVFMEARSEKKKDGVVLLYVSGKVTYFGAQQMEHWAKDALSDDDKHGY